MNYSCGWLKSRFPSDGKFLDTAKSLLTTTDRVVVVASSWTAVANKKTSREIRYLTSEI